MRMKRSYIFMRHLQCKRVINRKIHILIRNGEGGGGARGGVRFWGLAALLKLNLNGNICSTIWQFNELYHANVRILVKCGWLFNVKKKVESL